MVLHCSCTVRYQAKHVCVMQDGNGQIMLCCMLALLLQLVKPSAIASEEVCDCSSKVCWLLEG